MQLHKVKSLPARGRSRQYREGETLDEMAAKLWPDSEHNREAWKRSVGHLRSFTPSRWKLDATGPLSPR